MERREGREKVFKGSPIGELKLKIRNKKYDCERAIQGRPL
jgi:hypothetical protein